MPGPWRVEHYPVGSPQPAPNQVGYTLWDSLLLFRYRAHWSSVRPSARNPNPSPDPDPNPNPNPNPNPSQVRLYAVHHAGSILAWGLCAVSGYAHVIAVPALLFEATAPTLTLTLALTLSLTLA